jgi:hypothetical protein
MQSNCDSKEIIIIIIFKPNRILQKKKKKNIQEGYNLSSHEFWFYYE